MMSVRTPASAKKKAVGVPTLPEPMMIASNDLFGAMIVILG